MKSFVKWIALAPIFVVVLAFAVINRQPVVIGFDPFAEGASGYSLTTPLFGALFVAVAVGVFLGGVATWLGQSRHRRAAREARAELARLRAQAAREPAPAAPLALDRRPAA